MKLRRGRFRFRLATLLLFTTGLAIFLGYAQWRRQSLLQEVKAFQSRGIVVTVRDSDLRWLWPTVEKVATCNYAVSAGNVETASRVLTTDEWLAGLESSYDPLRDMGVEDIQFFRRGEPEWYYVSTKRGK